MLHLIFCHNIYLQLQHMECTTPRAQLMLMVAHLEPIDLTLFMIQTISNEAQSIAKEGLPDNVMLTRFILDAGVVVTRHEPTMVQLGPIKSVTV